MNKKNILLIVTGSIAACKVPLLITGLKNEMFDITTIITKSGKKFITPLTISSLTSRPTYEKLFLLKDEAYMNHIKLSREADIILVAPASSNIIANMAYGFARDLASSVLLAANKPIFVAPAMNIYMWNNKAVQRNIDILKNDGIHIIGPIKGDLACGEQGYGKMSEPIEIVETVKNFYENTYNRGRHN